MITPDKTLEVDLDKAKTNLRFSEIVDSVYFVPLETHEDCLIGNIGRLLFHDSLMVIQEAFGGQGRVYMFNLGGRFVRTIGSIGRGSGEYTKGTDVQLVDGNVQILDNSGSHVVSYDLDGRFVGRKKIGFASFQFVFHEEKYYIRGGVPGTNTLFTTTKDFKAEASYFPHQNSWLNMIETHPFWVADGFVHYARPYDNTVYNLSEGTPKPHLFVDYLDKAISYAEVSKKGFDFESSTSNYAFTRLILENKNHMMVATLYQDRPYITLVDKILEKQLTYPHLQIEHDVTGESRSHPIAVRDDGWFVYNIDPSNLVGKEAGKRDERLDDILRTATEFSNPILMMVKFKL